MNNNYFENKRVVVTGGCGFVGSHLCEFLAEAGADVYAVDNMSRGKNVPVGCKLLALDASHLDTCKYAFKGGNAKENYPAVDIVFNLAATVAGVIHNQSHNVEMFNQNILLQTIPVAAAEAVGVKRFIQVSSVCVYASSHNHPCLEENGHMYDPNRANGGYALAKRMGEKIAHLSAIPEVVIVRPSNAYGPRDYFDERAHVIPALIEKTINDPMVKLYGSPANVREFIYVTDLARGMMAAAEYGRDRQAYNLGTNGVDRLTMRDLAEAIVGIVGIDKDVVCTMANGGGDPDRWSNASKANKELHWSADTPLEVGLNETIKWRVNRDR